MNTVSDVTTYRVRVGYADTDQGGVVHHAVYWRWLEQGRVEYLRERGIEVGTLEKTDRATIVVAEANIRYRRPAHFDDLLDIETRVGQALAASVRFDYRVLRAGELLAESQTKLACIDLTHARPRRFPPNVAQALGTRSPLVSP